MKYFVFLVMYSSISIEYLASERKISKAGLLNRLKSVLNISEP